MYVTELGIAEDKTAQVKNAWSNDETRELILYSQAHPLEDEDLWSTTFLHAGDKRPNIIKTIQVHMAPVCQAYKTINLLREFNIHP